ncbi:hypothetical protein AAFF_G00336650 [Aldrovandia affinis]|uniref:Uncharacterized protein n=1 Tax=Aldrovandia affinis TaxID=143900 RepID=A0AAD7R657_9TELE|nr:hypothetical protein AAFF_G00336650 [Aldrovandia affinis]
MGSETPHTDARRCPQSRDQAWAVTHRTEIKVKRQALTCRFRGGFSAAVKDESPSRGRAFVSGERSGDPVGPAPRRERSGSYETRRPRINAWSSEGGGFHFIAGARWQREEREVRSRRDMGPDEARGELVRGTGRRGAHVAWCYVNTSAVLAQHTAITRTL